MVTFARTQGVVPTAMHSISVTNYTAGGTSGHSHGAAQAVAPLSDVFALIIFPALQPAFPYSSPGCMPFQEC